MPAGVLCSGQKSRISPAMQALCPQTDVQLEPVWAVAGVLAALLQMQADPTPLSLLITQVIASEAAQLAQGEQQKAAGSNDKGSASWLPIGKEKKGKRKAASDQDREDGQQPVPVLHAEAQPLASLWALARRLLSDCACADGNGKGDDASRQQDGSRAATSGTGTRHKKRKHEALEHEGLQQNSQRMHVEQPASCFTSRAALTVSGSEQAWERMANLISGQHARASAKLDVLDMQTALLCAPAEKLATHLPAVARLCAKQASSVSPRCMQVLVRVCQAHALNVLDCPSVAKSACRASESKNGHIASLFEASQPLLLLQSAVRHSGEKNNQNVSWHLSFSSKKHEYYTLQLVFLPFSQGKSAAVVVWYWFVLIEVPSDDHTEVTTNTDGTLVGTHL
jgi:hypothetical protein